MILGHIARMVDVELYMLIAFMLDFRSVGSNVFPVLSRTGIFLKKFNPGAKTWA